MTVRAHDASAAADGALGVPARPSTKEKGHENLVPFLVEIALINYAPAVAAAALGGSLTTGLGASTGFACCACG